MRIVSPLLAALLLTASAQAAPRADRVVVMASVDGLADYYFDDPKAEMPAIRALAREGVRAQSVTASMPTVTWPNHTTLVTGVSPAKHGVIGNSYYDRATGKIVPLLPDPLLNKDEIVKVPTVYDLAKAAGLRTAAIIWPASRGAATLDWTVPDVMTDALFQQYGTPALLEECRAAGIPIEKQEEYCKTGNGQARDLMYVRMLGEVIHRHRPNLALIHLVELDHVEHAHGPQSPEAYATVKFEDDRVAEIRALLEREFPGKATLLVVSDHGFMPYRQTIQPNVLLRKEGLLQSEGNKITGGAARAVGQGGASYLYLLDPARRAELTRTLADSLRQVEGVSEVLTPAEFAAAGLPDPDADPHMAELVLSAKKGYTFSDSLAGDLVVTPLAEETKGSHGFDPHEPGMNATFVAWGAGLTPSHASLGTIPNTSIAPTVAALLGFRMPMTDSAPLPIVLDPPAP